MTNRTAVNATKENKFYQLRVIAGYKSKSARNKIGEMHETQDMDISNRKSWESDESMKCTQQKTGKNNSLDEDMDRCDSFTSILCNLLNRYSNEINEDKSATIKEECSKIGKEDFLVMCPRLIEQMKKEQQNPRSMDLLDTSFIEANNKTGNCKDYLRKIIKVNYFFPKKIKTCKIDRLDINLGSKRRHDGNVCENQEGKEDKYVHYSGMIEDCLAGLVTSSKNPESKILKVHQIVQNGTHAPSESVSSPDSELYNAKTSACNRLFDKNSECLDCSEHGEANIIRKLFLKKDPTPCNYKNKNDCIEYFCASNKLARKNRKRNNEQCFDTAQSDDLCLSNTNTKVINCKISFDKIVKHQKIDRQKMDKIEHSRKKYVEKERLKEEKSIERILLDKVEDKVENKAEDKAEKKAEDKAEKKAEQDFFDCLKNTPDFSFLTKNEPLDNKTKKRCADESGTAQNPSYNSATPNNNVIILPSIQLDGCTNNETNEFYMSDENHKSSNTSSLIVFNAYDDKNVVGFNWKERTRLKKSFLLNNKEMFLHNTKSKPVNSKLVNSKPANPFFGNDIGKIMMSLKNEKFLLKFEDKMQRVFSAGHDSNAKVVNTRDARSMSKDNVKDGNLKESVVNVPIADVNPTDVNVLNKQYLRALYFKLKRLFKKSEYNKTVSQLLLNKTLLLMLESLTKKDTCNITLDSNLIDFIYTEMDYRIGKLKNKDQEQRTGLGIMANSTDHLKKNNENCFYFQKTDRIDANKLKHCQIDGIYQYTTKHSNASFSNMVFKRDLFCKESEKADNNHKIQLKTKKKSDKLYVCQYEGCNNRYNSSYGLNYHLQNGHVDRKNDPEYQKKPFPCTINGCDNRYKNLNGLKYHCRKKHNIKEN